MEVTKKKNKKKKEEKWSRQLAEGEKARTDEPCRESCPTCRDKLSNPAALNNLPAGLRGLRGDTPGNAALPGLLLCVTYSRARNYGPAGERERATCADPRINGNVRARVPPEVELRGARADPFRMMIRRTRLDTIMSRVRELPKSHPLPAILGEDGRC